MTVRRFWGAALALLAIVAVGCGKSTENSGTPANATNAGADSSTGPAAIVAEFLEAIRTGDDEKAKPLLSSVARERNADKTSGITPPASDTARFELGEVEYIGQDGARVAATWTDLDENGKPQSDRALWACRREPEGWRVVGLAAFVFEGEAPVIFDFENPKEMAEKQEWLRAEMARRAKPEGIEAQTGKNSQDSFLR
jgi:hypothetical protein